MTIIQILTPWTGSGIDDHDAYRPLVIDAYPVREYTDVTAQPCANISPTPNLFVAEIECDAATADLIDADPAYAVLWRVD